jgi:hypothetical protein
MLAAPPPLYGLVGRDIEAASLTRAGCHAQRAGGRRGGHRR